MYTPVNLCVFQAAITGALAGMATHERTPTSIVAADSQPFVSQAEQFAEVFDTFYPGVAHTAQLQAITQLCQSAWSGRMPIPVSLFAPATFLPLCRALYAILDELGTVLAGQGIPDNCTGSPYAPNWTVGNWYIDGTIGNDSNDGLTILTPLRTGAELFRRLGPWAMWIGNVTIHVGINGMTDALVVNGTLLVAGTHLDIVGTPTQLAAGQVTTYTAQFQGVYGVSLPETTLLTSAAIADWTAYKRRRLRIVGGANDTAVCWIGNANPVGTAHTTRWVKIDQAANTTQIAAVTPAVGNDFVIESLPQVPGVQIRLAGPVKVDATALWPQRQYSIQHISAVTVDTDSPAHGYIGRSLIFGCRLGCAPELHSTQSPFTDLDSATACSFYNPSGITIQSGRMYMHGGFDSCLFGEDSQQTYINTPFGVRFNYCIFEGASLISQPRSIVFMTNCQIMNVVGTNTLNVQGDGYLLAVATNGGTGYGWSIANQSRCQFSSGANAPNMHGALGDARLASAPATTITVTQATTAFKDDGAQSGNAVLGAGGLIDVVVPYVDWTLQKVTLTVNTPAGVPGSLSAPTANRTSTGFRIVSTSAADTSTVDWAITPCGRGVYIGSA